MAMNNVLFAHTLKAGADLTAKEGFLAKLDANGDAVLGAAGTDNLEGVIVTENTSGLGVAVQTDGIAKVVAGGVVAIGDRITSDATGKGITTVTVGNYAIGKALTSAASNEKFEMRIERWKI